MPINVSIFAHIHLDSELQGRYGVQGNLFQNTVGYLNEYMELLKKGANPSRPPYYQPDISINNLDQLETITTALNQLVVEEGKLITLNDSNSRTSSLKNNADRISNSLLKLKKGDDFLLPGGWKNLTSSGHSMIYQFTKSPSGTLLFSIYNAGAGLSQHEKTSSTTSERYLPVKTYELATPINQKELSILLQRLTLARLPNHPVRKEEHVDEQKLYQNIEKSLPFLNAKIIPSSVDLTKTTAGQITGTCSQRSIHQMLKLNFDTLPNYQRFIFDFKMHSLQDFINTHPMPRHQAITNLIQLAIENNLKLLQEPGLFTNTSEMRAAAQELIALKETILKPIPASGSSGIHQPAVSSHKYGVHPDFFNNFNAFSDNVAPTKYEHRPAITIQRNSSTPLLQQMKNLLAQCEHLKDTDPLWVCDQIEHAAIHLPLPTQGITPSKDVRLTNYYAEIPFYKQISKPEEFEQMRQLLINLQKMHAYTGNKLLGKNKTPQMVVTHCSFLALHDYFEVAQLKQQHMQINTQPGFHNYMSSMLGLYLDSFRLSPHMATNHPDFDERLLALRRLHPGQTFYDSEIEDYFKSFYIELLNSEPLLKNDLENEYNRLFEQNYSEEHSAVKKEGLGALYILFQQFEHGFERAIIKNTSMLKQNKFSPLVNKIEQQFQQEQFFVRCLYSLLHDPVNTALKPNVSFDKEENKLKINTINYLQEAQNVLVPTLENPLSIAHNKYSLTKSVPRKALLADYAKLSIWHGAPKKASSNKIQLSPNGEQTNSVISKEDFFHREFFHLRSSPANQVNLTLDYFSSSIHKLKNSDVQGYMEANFFEPGLLRQTLDSDPEFINRFDAFIEKGLHFFKNSAGLTSQESLFFIRLRYNLNSYVAYYKPEYAKRRLKNNQLHISALIAAEPDAQVVASLHQYRFLTAMTCHKLNEMHEDSNTFAEMFHSYCFIQAQKNLARKEDITSTLELLRAEKACKDWLQSVPASQFEDLIKPIVANLGINLTNVIQSGSFPLFKLYNPDTNSTFLVNAEQGRVYKDNKSYGSTPLDIQTHPIMRALGLAIDTPCFLSADGNTLEFVNANGLIRMNRSIKGLRVQKEWVINGRKEWHELQALEEAQRTLLKLENPPCQNHLPACLTDGRSLAWVKRDRSAFIAQNNRPVYVIPLNKAPEQVDQEGFQNGLQLTGNSQWQNALSLFENPGFYCVNYNSINKNGAVDFVRFGLSLTISENNLLLPDTNYQVATLRVPPFKPEISCLTFRDNEGVHEQCIVTVAPFYINPSNYSNTTAGDFYNLTQDKEEYIGKEKLKKKWVGMGLAEKDWPQWHHHNSVDTITYQVINGVPQPQNAAEALYLCYLYLASHEQDKAWDVLNQLSQRFNLEGSLKEVTYLSWIINALPVALSKEDAENKLGTPRDIACQLKALALFTDLLAQDKKPIIPNPQSVDFSTANGQYQALCLQETRNFYNSLPELIYQHYSQLQKVRRHLSEKYTLSDTECKSLLTYYHQNIPGEEPKALGALGYEWRRLSLKSLYKEYHRLTALEKSGQLLNPALQKRLIEIKAHIDNHVPIMKKSTILELRDLDLTLPPNSQVNEGLLNYAAKTFFWQWKYNVLETKNAGSVDEALNALNSAISEESFIKYFPIYLQIAMQNNNENTQRLLQFCTNCLIGNRHLSLNKQDTNIPFLVNIVYRVKSNPRILQGYVRVSLSSLVAELSKIPVIPLPIYQARDVFEEELSTNKKIWNDLIKEIPEVLPMDTPALVLKEDLTMQGVVNQCLSAGKGGNALSVFYKAYEQAGKDYESQLNQLLTEEDEQKAGQLQYECLHKQQELARTTLNSTAVRGILHANASIAQQQIANVLASKWSLALERANKELKHGAAIQIAASQKRLLTQKDLLKYYLHADLATYIETTGLDIEECKELHALLHECVTLEVEKQHCERLLDAVNQVKEPPKPTHLDTIASVFMSTNLAEAKNSPAAMLFQYEENILLRHRQLEAIKSLLSENESVEKVIPGGGKSTVISPLTAEMLATGLNLVIFEVPRALLPTNHNDLNKLSQERFGKKAHRFEFDRNSNCSAQRLEEIYQQFTDIMTNKEYLVTIGEAMQSLELKYLELLFTRPESEKAQVEWKKQVYWAGKITHLIKNRGDAIIDEGHKALLLKKKLNYSLGDPQPINHEFIQHAVALYKFVDSLVHEQYPENPDSLQKSIEIQWPTCLDQLVNKLLTHPASPLLKYVTQLQRQYGTEVVARLEAYLNNQEEPKILQVADQATKDAFAFYKEQVGLLPQTLKRHYKEHYGPSKSNQKSALRRLLAIPYFANDKPNELSRFGNLFETANYTIQGLLISGLDTELLSEIITQWQNEARIELQTQFTLYKTIDDTPTAKGVAHYLKRSGFTLNTIKPDNLEHINELLTSLKYNKALLFTLLQEEILPQITTEPSILHSDSFNHVDLYRSVKLLSGTPDNHNTFHQRLQYNFKASIGTDGFIDEVLKKKKTPIHALDFTNITLFLEQLYSQVQSPQTLRAIMDVSATFTGLSNFQVAQALVAFHTNQNTKIQYVLYFNENDVLCALDVQHNKAPIILATSDTDEINRLLNCQPDDRFTYYDQDHTEGTDIKQGEDSSAVCMVKPDTQAKSFRQGCKRMRDIEKNQRIEIIVPDSMKGISLDTLQEDMEQRDLIQLREDIFVSAMAQLTNVIRNDFMLRLDSLSEDDVDTKHQWATKFRAFFVDDQDTKIWEQYGAIYHTELTDVLFNKHRAHLNTCWKNCLESIEQPLSEVEEERLEKEMQKIIKKALPLCNTTAITKAQGKKDLEVENQKEKEVLKEIEKVREDMCYDPSLEQADYAEWYLGTLNGFSKNQGINKSFIKPLNNACNLVAQDGISPIFSKNLLVSSNYSSVYTNQNQMLGPYLKPVHAIFFRVINNKVSACIISNEELEQLTTLLKNNPYITNVWLSTTQHSVLAGKRPINMLNNAKYLQLMEQIQLFGGKCQELQEQKTPFLWLSEKTNEKLAFFETNIFHYRETETYEFHNLKSALSKKNVGFEYLANHPFADYSNFDWKMIAPDALSSDITLLQKVSFAFAEVNNTFMNQKLKIEQLQNKYTLPPAALSCLDNHLTILNEFKEFLEKLESGDVALENLKADSKTMLEQILYCDLDTLLNKYHIDANNINTEESDRKNYNLDVLNALLQLPIIKNKKPLQRLIENNFKHQDESYLAVFINHERTEEKHLQMLLHYSKPSAELLCQVVNRAQNIETLLKVMTHNTVNQQVFSTLLNRADINLEMIGKIIEKTYDYKIIEMIINQLNAQNTLFNDDVLQELLKSRHLPMEHLLSKCVSEQSLQALLNANFPLNAKHFILLSNTFKDQENRELIFRKALSDGLLQTMQESFSQVLLNFIAGNTRDQALLHTIINFSYAPGNPFNEKFTTKLLTNPALSITDLLKECRSQELIGAILQSHHLLNDAELIELSLKAESSENLKLILQKAIEKNIYSGLVNQRFIDKLINNRQLPVDYLILNCQSEEFVLALVTSNRAFTLEQLTNLNKKIKKMDGFEHLIEKAFNGNLLPNFLQDIDINEEFLIPIAESTKSPEILKIFINKFYTQNYLLDGEFVKKILLNPVLSIDYLITRCHSDEIILLILQSNVQLNNEQLLALSKKTNNTAVFALIIEKSGDDVVFQTLLNQHALNIQALCLIAEKARAPETLKIIINQEYKSTTPFSAQLTQKLMANPRLPLDHFVITCQSKEAVDALIHSSLPLTSDHLIVLSGKSNNPASLKQILEHKECTSSVYFTVLKNKAFTESPAHLFDIVTNKNPQHFDLKMAKGFLQKASNPFEAYSSKNPELIKLENALNDLRKKSLSFIEKAEKGKKGKYMEASKAAFSLYVLLNNQSTSYLEKKITAESFSNIALKSIKKYEPELSKHRGGKQILFDFANGLLFIPGLIKYAITSRFRIFNANTKSEKIVGEIRANVPKI